MKEYIAASLLAVCCLALTILLNSRIAWDNREIPDSDRNNSKSSSSEDVQEDKAAAIKVCDCKNLTDFDEYYKNGIPVNYDGKYIYSHNEFIMSNGKLATVDLTSNFMEETKNGYDFWMNNYTYSRVEDTGGVEKPQAYNETSSVSFHIDKPFLLKLADYNLDGNPDYIIRTSELRSGGAYYSLNYMMCDNYADHSFTPATWYLSSDSDSSFFIWGEHEPSIVLRNIDREHFFFVSRDQDFEICTVVIDSGLYRCNTDDFAYDSRIYCAVYTDDGLRFDCVSTERYYGKDEELQEKASPYEGDAHIILRKLDGKVWRKTGTETDIAYKQKDVMQSFANTDIHLDKGEYQAEIQFPDFTAYAWFIVR